MWPVVTPATVIAMVGVFTNHLQRLIKKEIKYLHKQEYKINNRKQ